MYKTVTTEKVIQVCDQCGSENKEMGCWYNLEDGVFCSDLCVYKKKHNCTCDAK